jgi:hypothetical protein
MIKTSRGLSAALAGFCALSVLFVMATGQAHASTVPSAPASPVATPGIAGASVSFTPSVSDGGSPIIRYTVTSGHAGDSVAYSVRTWAAPVDPVERRPADLSAQVRRGREANSANGSSKKIDPRFPVCDFCGGNFFWKVRERFRTGGGI